MVTNNKIISEINEKYLGRKGPTNVISFSYIEDADKTAGYIGDIVISVEKAREEADESGITLEERFAHLFVHGLLHIYGLDHENSSEEEKLMEKLEEEIINEFKAFG